MVGTCLVLKVIVLTYVDQVEQGVEWIDHLGNLLLSKILYVLCHLTLSKSVVLFQSNLSFQTLSISSNTNLIRFVYC